MSVPTEASQQIPNDARVIGINGYQDTQRNGHCFSNGADAPRSGQQGTVVSDETRSLAVAGINHFERGQIRAAEASFRKILHYDPQNAWALNNLGVTLIKLGEYHEVIEIFERLALVLEAQGGPLHDLASAHQAVGAALMHLWGASPSEEGRSGYVKSAEIEFSKVVKEQPDYPDGWFGLGICYHIMDNLDEAEATLRKALQLSPEHGIVRDRLNAVLEDKLEKQLFELGYLSKRSEPITDFSPYKNRKLVEVSGKPLSETIIEERR